MRAAFEPRGARDVPCLNPAETRAKRAQMLEKLRHDFARDGAKTGVMKIPIEDSIDLHTFAPRDVVSVVEEYVTAAHEAGLREVRLIHGRGKGIQRGLVQQALEHHPLVVEFWDAPESHLGATVALLVSGQS
jgi:DNA-nicking Smr family endonuclease